MQRIRYYLTFSLFVLASIGTAATPVNDIDGRKAWLLDQMRPTQLDRDHPKFKTYDVLGITAATGCGPTEYAKYMSEVLTMTEVAADSVYNPEMFALPPLVRYLYQYGGCLSQVQKDHIAGLLSRKMHLFDHGTLNHAVLRATSWYLFAQYFPALQWHNKDGRKLASGELMAELKSLLLQRTSKFMQTGHYEQLSPTYAMVNFFPLLNLIDFAADEALRSAAIDEATLDISVLYEHSFQGVIVPPLTRRNFQQRNGPSPNKALDPSISQHVLWYYFGAPSLTANDIQSRREPVYVVMLALSKWRPSAEVFNLENSKKAPYQITTITPSFSHWGEKTVGGIYGKATIAKHFAIGAGNLVFDPADYNEDTQQFGIVLESKNVNNQIECYHPYWRGNLSEDAWSRDRSSPFMQTWLATKQGVLIFDIPTTDPWVAEESNRFFKLRSARKSGLHQFAQCRIPASFETVEVGENWVFVKEGKSYVALHTLAGKNEIQSNTANHELDDYIVFKVRHPKTAIYFQVAEQSANLSFTEFKRLALARAPMFDSNTLTVKLEGQSGQKVDIQFMADRKMSNGRVSSLPRVVLNGVAQANYMTPAISSPFLKLDGGHLRIGGIQATGSYK